MNDIPMSAICRTIEIELREMLLEKEIPPRLHLVRNNVISPAAWLKNLALHVHLDVESLTFAVLNLNVLKYFDSRSRSSMDRIEVS